jgi:hypothetical protein
MTHHDDMNHAMKDAQYRNPEAVAGPRGERYVEDIDPGPGQDINAKRIPSVSELLARAGNRDKELSQEIRQILDLLIEKMAEARAHDLIVGVALDNGAESGKPVLTAFRVEKRVMDYVNKEAMQQAQAQQRR